MDVGFAYAFLCDRSSRLLSGHFEAANVSIEKHGQAHILSILLTL